MLETVLCVRDKWLRDPANGENIDTLELPGEVTLIFVIILLLWYIIMAIRSEAWIVWQGLCYAGKS